MLCCAPAGFHRLTEEGSESTHFFCSYHLLSTSVFTMDKMRNLVLIVILHLIITIAETKDDLRFGDIIAFEGACSCKYIFTYNHYAVYVGDKTIDGKEKGQDIFHHTGTSSTSKRIVADCVFGKLKATDRYVKFNYLDGRDFKAGSDADIIKRIQERHRNCGTYWPLANNCEHLATYVRYGVKLSLQLGQSVENKCEIDSAYNIEDIKKGIDPKYLQGPKCNC